MNELTESELCEMTSHSESTAIAQCVEGLGCSVFADGRVLAPWASYKVEQLLEIYPRDAAVVTTRSETQYFVLSHDKDNEEFIILRGPLDDDGLRNLIDGCKESHQ